MSQILKLTVGALAVAALAGCVESTSGSGAPATAARAVPGDSPEGQARTNCVQAVQAQTGNPDVSVVSSSFSEAGTEVILRVGPTGTWRCIGYRDGSTAGVTSLTDEGAA